jgi:predicted esterase
MRILTVATILFACSCASTKSAEGGGEGGSGAFPGSAGGQNGGGFVNGGAGFNGAGGFVNGAGGFVNGGSGFFSGGSGFLSGGSGFVNGGSGFVNGGSGFVNGGSGFANGGAGLNGAGGDNGSAGQNGGGGQNGSVTACPGQNLLPVPDDPSVRGPWDVGVKTAKIGRLTVEIVYPALPGSTTNATEATYDIRKWLPPQEQSKVPDSHSPAVGPIGGHLFRDVPIDDQHGPYPVVIFVHGTASFRIASGTTVTQWASRGFVVMNADYPGLFLTDQLNAACGYPQTGAQDIKGDVNTQIQALTNPSGDVAFLAGHIDMTRLAIGGHSQGACETATELSTLANVQVVLPMSGSSTVTNPNPALKSIMWIAGIDDKVIGYNSSLIGNLVCAAATSDTQAWTASPGPPNVTKRLMGITGGGHLVPTDLCQTNAQGKNAIQEAQADGVCGINTAVIIGLPALFDCGTIAMADGLKAVDYASTAALEETLHCQDRSAQFANLKANLPMVGDFQHAP